MDIKQVNTDINIKNPIIESKCKDSNESDKKKDNENIEIERKKEEEDCAKLCCCCCCCYYLCIQVLTMT
jgi:hypothetical protein